MPELDRDETTCTELLVQHLPVARVVKAFNTMCYATIAPAGDPTKPPDERIAQFVAGDDRCAKQVAIDLIEQLGFAAIDSGSLARRRGPIRSADSSHPGNPRGFGERENGAVGNTP